MKSGCRSLVGEGEVVREKSLLACLLSLLLKNGEWDGGGAGHADRFGIPSRLPVGTSLMITGLSGSPADWMGLNTGFS